MEARKLVDFPGGLELHIGVRPLHRSCINTHLKGRRYWSAWTVSDKPVTGYVQPEKSSQALRENVMLPGMSCPLNVVSQADAERQSSQCTWSKRCSGKAS